MPTETSTAVIIGAGLAAAAAMVYMRAQGTTRTTPTTTTPPGAPGASPAPWGAKPTKVTWWQKKEPPPPNNLRNASAQHSYIMSPAIRASLSACVDAEVPMELAAPRVQAEATDEEVRSAVEYLVQRLSSYGSPRFTLICIHGFSKEADAFRSAFLSIDFSAYELTSHQTIRLSAALAVDPRGRPFVVSIRPWNSGLAGAEDAGVEGMPGYGEFAQLAAYTPKK